MESLDRSDILARTFLRESEFNRRRTWLPLGIFAIDLCAIGFLFFAVLVVGPAVLKILLGVLLGALIARLFVIGHDACHGSFTASRRLNAIVGRVAFLPSLTPFGPWALAHNRLHHAYTNVKGWDYVWAPLSHQEWLASSARRRLMERFYRTPLGHGPNYAFEIWMKHLVVPRAKTRQKWLPSYWWDLLLVAVFAISVVACVAMISGIIHQSLLIEVLCALVLPFSTWNALMGLVIYLHHTDPDILWVASLTEQMQQTKVTAHVAFPRIFNAFFHNIMDHPAHHVDPLIPLYNLWKAEAALVKAFPEYVHLRRFTVGTFWQTVTQCKLYDYEGRRWLDFRGNATTLATESYIHDGVNQSG